MIKLKHSLTLRQKEVLRLLRQGYALSNIGGNSYLKSPVGASERVDITTIERLKSFDLLTENGPSYKLTSKGQQKL